MIENNCQKKKNNETIFYLRGEMLTTILPKVALASINLKFNLLAVATSGLDEHDDHRARRAAVLIWKMLILDDIIGCRLC